MQDAGADALELNLYHVAADPAQDRGRHGGARTSQLIAAVRAAITIPLAVKLSPYYSALASFARRAVERGADGLVLFNRFYQPDLDLETLDVVAPARAEPAVRAAPADALDRDPATAAGPGRVAGGDARASTAARTRSRRSWSAPTSR